MTIMFDRHGLPFIRLIISKASFGGLIEGLSSAYTSAMSSTSQRTLLGSCLTATQERAGWLVK
ncbi:MAG: hypothetical protein H6Q60_769 [Oscillospiraceae bacterium]|nr:hypothetical protein [Oscillospiraceae bacterium]